MAMLNNQMVIVILLDTMRIHQDTFFFSPPFLLLTFSLLDLRWLKLVYGCDLLPFWWYWWCRLPSFEINRMQRIRWVRWPIGVPCGQMELLRDTKNCMANMGDAEDSKESVFIWRMINHTHIHIYIHINIYTHTYIYIHMPPSNSSWCWEFPELYKWMCSALGTSST